MLVKCPKCHFEQPVDPFCAKCGIEMATYKPPAGSLVSKIFKNATAVFFIIVIGLFGGTFFFLKANRVPPEGLSREAKKFGLSQRQYINDQNSHIEVTGGLKPGANGEPHSTTPGEKHEGSTHIDSSAHNSGKDIKDQSPDEIRANLENQLFKKNSGGNEEPAQKQFYLHVYYAEVSSKGMELLYQESRTSGQMSNTDFAQGVVTMPMAKILTYRDDFSVYNELTKPFEKSRKVDWFQGLKSAGQDGDIGLTNTVQLKDSASGRLQLEVRISKRFQVGNPEAATKSFQVTDFVGGGELADNGHSQTYFMAEILSKYPMSSQQEYLMAISPFEIYKSQSFANGKSFSVFFYTVENK